MLSIKKLSFANAGRFVGAHEIDFTQYQGLSQVDAKNLNTGGGSGGGKTTIFNAIEYALGVNEVAATKLQSRLTEDPLWVRLELDCDGSAVAIERGKGQPKLTIDGVLSSGSAALVDQKLRDLMGIDHRIVRRVFHKRQGEGGFFLSLTPKETHEFLSHILGLDQWQAKMKKASEDAGLAVADALKENTKVAMLSDRLAAALNRKQSLTPPVEPQETKAIPAFRAAEARLLEEILSLESEIARVRQAVATPAPPQPADTSCPVETAKLAAARQAADAATRAFQAELRDHASRRHQLQSELDASRRAAKELPAAHDRLAKAKQDMQTLQSGACPTCQQNMPCDNTTVLAQATQAARLAFDTVRSLEAEASLLDARTASLMALVAPQAPDNQDLRAAEYELAAARLVIQNLNAAAMAAYAETVASLESRRAAAAKPYQDSLSNARAGLAVNSGLLNAAAAKQAAYEATVAEFEKHGRHCDAEIGLCTEQLATAKLAEAGAKQKQDTCALAVAQIRNYINCLFSDALDHIGNRATQIVSKIPNMATAVLRLDGFKETKSGTIKEEVAAVLNVDADLNVPVDTISGGERAAIDLAVDLAVIEMIEDRTAKGFDFFILDEPFDGLDSVCREECLQMLAEVVRDKKIFVVDHSEETKQMVGQKITVVREGLYSRVA